MDTNERNRIATLLLGPLSSEGVEYIQISGENPIVFTLGRRYNNSRLEIRIKPENWRRLVQNLHCVTFFKNGWRKYKNQIIS